mgnify:FL=1
MKNYLKLILWSLFAFASTNYIHAQCAATSVDAAPQPSLICEGDSEIVTFTASGVCTGGSWQYQVNFGATTLQIWSTTATFTASPDTTTTYTVFARCSGCPTTVVQTDFIVEVLQEPTVVADTVVCANTSATLSASGSIGTYEWYDDATAGNLLSSSPTFITPPLTQDTTYWVSVTDTSSTANTGSVLITECGLGGFPGASSADYLEISNLYTTPVVTTGWVAAVSNSYTLINSYNSTLWSLPTSFTACSVLNKTDVSGQTNYWGSNIFWNPGNNGWAIIIDNLGNVVDFVSWGWTTAQLATFNPIINGFFITLGTEWLGASVNSACGANSTAIPASSITRIGNTDNNNAGDFVCQLTSLNIVNPSLFCGWTVNKTCRYPITILVDVPPTASNPLTVNVQCIGDVPAPDITVVFDEADDYTAVPIVAYVGDVSSGLTCPDTIIRTYSVTDSCGNSLNVQQLIIVDDTIAPVVDPAPPGFAVQCVGDIPPATSLPYTDNCSPAGTILSTDGPLIGGGCGGTVTRSWIATDACGNNSIPVTQVFTVNDTILPTTGTLLPMTVQCIGDIPVPDTMIIPSISDNCTAAPSVAFVADISDGLTCPETITRTYSVTDNCGNQITVDQTFTINDTILPTASNPSPINVAVIANVPSPDITAVTDEADNCTVNPIVTWVSDVSDSAICTGETIVRTYSVMDDCSNEIFVTQQITVDPFQISIDAGPDQTICVDDLITITPINPTGGNLTWNPAIASGPFVPAATATYTVTTELYGCQASDQITIIVEAPPVVSFTADTLQGCEPLEVTFNSTSTAASGVVDCSWLMNGQVLNGCSNVAYTFPTGGTYNVALITTSATGCVDSATYANFIYVEATPVAEFDVSLTELASLEPTAEFYNLSTGATSYQWNFNDNSTTSTSVETNPIHDFPTSNQGSYNVELVAISPLGCADTAYRIIKVIEELIYYVPNSFTPDGDQYNQIFQPVFTTGFDPQNFEIKIYDRWGEVVWESFDPSAGWDGTYEGKISPSGAYTWVVTFKMIYNEERKVLTGHVTIL